jgi:hypothetical protein
VGAGVVLVQFQRLAKRLLGHLVALAADVDHAEVHVQVRHARVGGQRLVEVPERLLVRRAGEFHLSPQRLHERQLLGV